MTCSKYEVALQSIWILLKPTFFKPINEPYSSLLAKNRWDWAENFEEALVKMKNEPYAFIDTSEGMQSMLGKSDKI